MFTHIWIWRHDFRDFPSSEDNYLQLTICQSTFGPHARREGIGQQSTTSQRTTSERSTLWNRVVSWVSRDHSQIALFSARRLVPNPQMHARRKWRLFRFKLSYLRGEETMGFFEIRKQIKWHFKDLVFPIKMSIAKSSTVAGIQVKSDPSFWKLY